jgi:hypothetical protein
MEGSTFVVNSVKRKFFSQPKEVSYVSHLNNAGIPGI